MHRPTYLSYCSVSLPALYSGMDCGNLSKEQLEQLTEQMGRSFQYFRVLKERMENGKFPYNDELRQRVTHVCDALHSLWVSLHYLSCKG